MRERSPPEAKALWSLPTFLPFGNAKKSDICVFFAKNHGLPQNWERVRETGGLPPGSGLKQPLVFAAMLLLMDVQMNDVGGS